MAFRKKAGTSKEVFALTLPLRHELWERDRLDKLFRNCNALKNALISKELGKLAQLERTCAWREIQAVLAASYAAEKAEKDEAKQKLICKARKPWLDRRNALISQYGFNYYVFEADIKIMRKHFGRTVHSHVAQKIATDVWKAFEAYLYGTGKDISHSQISKLYTIEGKDNKTGITYENGMLHIGKLNLVVSRSCKDIYGYETEALSRKVHYCRIMREPGPNGWQYYAQLILSGTPPVKVKPDTGELLHPLGQGRVGNDIGPQTLATVSDTSASLVVFCERAQDIQNELRHINNAMDRSRRATNPQMFDQRTGEVIPIDKLPAECIVIRHGQKRRKWVKSKRYERLAQMRRYLYHQQAKQRRLAHNELANKLLGLGDEHYIETMNWKGLAKRAKKTEVSPKTGCYKRKKRFGKSIANKAPALFTKIYEQKVLAAGGSFYRIDTGKAKASQYSHDTKAYKKKQLSKRWHELEDGTKIQRDLYSAFLIQNTNSTLDGFRQDLLEAHFAQFKQYHDAEVERLMHFQTPSSTGIKQIA